jgi:hemerythrin-like domain-containing protein
MRLRTLVTAGAVIAATQVVAACGETADQDLCGQFADLSSAGEALQQQDPLTAKADEMRSAAEEFEAELDQFQAVSEGRLDTAISTLRANVDAVRQAAVDERTEALETARPLLEESLEDVSQSWAALQDLVAVQCDTT